LELHEIFVTCWLGSIHFLGVSLALWNSYYIDSVRTSHFINSLRKTEKIFMKISYWGASRHLVY